MKRVDEAIIAQCNGMAYRQLVFKYDHVRKIVSDGTGRVERKLHVRCYAVDDADICFTVVSDYPL